MHSTQLSLSFDSIDHLAEAMGYDLDFRQLESGRLCAGVTSTQTGSVVQNNFLLDRSFHQRGKMPDDVLTFGYLRQGGNLRWAGKDVDASSLLNFNSRSGFDLKSHHCFDAKTVHVDRRRLLDTAEALGVKLVYLGSEEFAAPCACEPVQFESLRATLDVAEKWVSPASGSAMTKLAPEEIEAEIYRQLAQCLGHQARKGTGRGSVRFKILQRTLSFIDEHLREGLTVTEVCRASGTSIRTLQRTFLEELGISPKQYIQLAKLTAVRRQLLDSNQRTLVAKVALSWGFWHMGQFEQDYRRQFGELPSETVNGRAGSLYGS